MNNKPPVRSSKPKGPITNDMRAKETDMEVFLDVLSTVTALDKIKWNCESAEDLNESEKCRENHPIFSVEMIKSFDNSPLELKHMAIAYNSKAFGPECHMKRDLYFMELINGIRFYLVSVENNYPSDEDEKAEAIEAIFTVPDEPSAIYISSLDNSYLVKNLLKLYQTVELHSRYPLLSDKMEEAIEIFGQNDIK